MPLSDNSSDAGEVELKLLSSGTNFGGRYQIIRCLGAGGMGAVYEVLHNETQRRRILKTMLANLLSDADMRARFKLEATITANIESDHIVEVFDAGFDDATGLPFLVMEYLRGENLAKVLRVHGPLPAADVVTLLRQASLALDRTHSAGIVHRDLKPENLFLTQRDDGSPRLKLLDFGIAKVVAQTTNVNTTRSFGTPLYMSPEQIRGDGDIDGRADLYALAQIGYTLLVGHAYWEPETESVSGVYPLLLKVMRGLPEPASERAKRYGITLPAQFDEWFHHATQPEASRRFDSAAEMVDELAIVLGVAATQREARGKLIIHEQPALSPTLLAASVNDPQVQVATLAGVANTGENIKEAQGSSPLTRQKRWVPLAIGGAALGVVALLGSVLGRGSAPRFAGINSDAVASLASPSVTAKPDTEQRAAARTSTENRFDAGLTEAANAAGSASAPLTAGKLPKGSASRASANETRSSRGGANRVRATPNSAQLGYDPSDQR